MRAEVIQVDVGIRFRVGVGFMWGESEKDKMHMALQDLYNW